MNKSKYIIVIIIFLLTCGCNNNEANKIDYNLNIYKSFDEIIDIYLDKNAKKIALNDEKSDNTSISLEYSMLKNEQYPIFGNNDIVYNKKINNNHVELSYNYTEDEFINNNYIMSCFENYEINSDDSSFSIDLSGKFKCYDNNDINNINIIVNTSYDIIDTNGEKSNKGYKWNINRDNYQNIDIYLKLSRSYDNMIKDNIKHENNNIFFGILKIIFLIFVLFLIFKIYKVYKKRTEV